MASSVVSLAEPFFLKVLRLVNQPAVSESSQLAQLQRLLKADLQAIEHKVSSGHVSISAGEWQSLKKVLIYWADEVLTSHIADWEDFVLEHEYFAERNRAWKFYVEAEQCVPTGSPASAELFYLAVVLGFVGDLEGAFKHDLQQDMPGGKSDPGEARRYWAGQLQRQIRHEAASNLQGEPLIGDVEPLSGEGMFRTALSLFLVSTLVFSVVLGWLVFGTPAAP